MKKIFIPALVICLLLSATAVFSPVTAVAAIDGPNLIADPNNDPVWQLTWEDNFNGSAVDTTKWAYEQGAGGYGNSEMQNYRASNARVENGELIIKAEPQAGKNITSCTQDNTYWSSKLWTKGLFSQAYGRFEAKISVPVGEGFWPAFWMLSQDNSYGGWPFSGEIDIMEARGRVPDRFGGAIHFGHAWPANQWVSKDWLFHDGTNISNYHVYTVEWDPMELRYYCDGYLYQTIKNTQWFTDGAPNSPTAPFDKPFYLILNLAVGGTFDSPNYPGKLGGPKTGEMKVDYVRVYQKKTTTPPSTLPKEGDTIILTANRNNLIVASSDRDPVWSTGTDTLTTLKAASNSISGIETYATYQVHYENSRAYLKAGNNKYVTIEGSSYGNQMIRPRTAAVSPNQTDWAALQFEQQADGSLKIFRVGTDGKFYIDVQSNGNLASVANSVGDTGKFTWQVYGSNQNLALNKTTNSSSNETSATAAYNAVDGDATTTRWSSAFSDNQWISVDLGQSYIVSKTVFKWQNSRAATFQVQVSNDNVNWTTVANCNGTDGVQTVTFTPVNTRYVRMMGLTRKTVYGFSMFEFEVYN